MRDRVAGLRGYFTGLRTWPQLIGSALTSVVTAQLGLEAAAFSSLGLFNIRLRPKARISTSLGPA